MGATYIGGDSWASLGWSDALLGCILARWDALGLDLGTFGDVRAAFFEVLGDSLELSGSHLGSAARAGAQSGNGGAQFGHAWAN